MKTLQSITMGPSFGGAPQAKTQMNLDPIKNVLGDDMPNITPDPLGKYRLLNALKNKFGPTFRTHPSAISALHHFEKEYHYFRSIRSTLAGGGVGQGAGFGAYRHGGNLNG